MRSQDSTLINSWVEVFACMVMHFINTSFWIQFCTSNLAVNYKFIYLSNYFEALGEAKNYVFFSFFFWTGGVTLSNPIQDGPFRDCSDGWRQRADISISSPEISKFFSIKKYSYALHNCILIHNFYVF